MHARDSLHRKKHVELTSQQRRLRHVTSISARNVTPRKGFANLNKLGIYFTLHLNDEAFYTSEIKTSFNPTWQSFDISQLSEDLNTFSTSFVVRIWGGENKTFQLLIEWNVDLNGLSYLDEIIRQDGDCYEPNSIIFGLQDGYYVAPKDPEVVEHINESSLSSSLLKVDQGLVKSSYNLSSLHRLHTLVRAIRQTQIQIRKIKTAVQKNLHVTRSHLLQASERDRLKLSVNMLQEELLKHKKILKLEQVKEKELVEQVKSRGDELKKRVDGFEVVKQNFDQARKTYIAKRETLVKTNAQLLMRRKQLCHELTYIYPIELSRNKETVVCGLPLPNTQSPEFNAANEETLSSAFGYVCHMVSMIGRFFQIPLRYPAKNKGSRSTVSDFVNEKLPERDREFPLFVKGKEKVQFEFGVFLLNKNIAQVRLCLGLSTSDLRLTLPNIKSLFDTKFGGSSPYRTRPVSVIAPPVSPPPKQLTSNAGTKNLENTSEKVTEQSTTVVKTRLDETGLSEEYVVAHANGTDMESVQPTKPQTSQHKFLAAGQKKSLSFSHSFGQRKETRNEETQNRQTFGKNFECNEDSPECMLNDQISDTMEGSNETGDSLQIPDANVDQAKQLDTNIENLFNV